MEWVVTLVEVVKKSTITDWIVAIATVVYVVATIAIMHANKKATSMSEKQIKEGREQFEKQQRLSIRPYLNAYVARDGVDIDKDEHYEIVIDKEFSMSCQEYRQFSIKNIGNGAAKDIHINYVMEGDLDLRKELPVRNGFLLMDKLYVYDVFFDHFKSISLSCFFTDLYDNRYKQEMEIYYDSEKDDIIAHTYNPMYIVK